MSAPFRVASLPGGGGAFPQLRHYMGSMQRATLSPNYFRRHRVRPLPAAVIALRAGASCNPWITQAGPTPNVPMAPAPLAILSQLSRAESSANV